MASTIIPSVTNNVENSLLEGNVNIVEVERPEINCIFIKTEVNDDDFMNEDEVDDPISGLYPEVVSCWPDITVSEENVIAEENNEKDRPDVTVSEENVIAEENNEKDREVKRKTVIKPEAKRTTTKKKKSGAITKVCSLPELERYERQKMLSRERGKKYRERMTVMQKEERRRKNREKHRQKQEEKRLKVINKSPSEKKKAWINYVRSCKDINLNEQLNVGAVSLPIPTDLSPDDRIKMKNLNLTVEEKYIWHRLQNRQKGRRYRSNLTEEGLEENIRQGREKNRKCIENKKKVKLAEKYNMTQEEIQEKKREYWRNRKAAQREKKRKGVAKVTTSKKDSKDSSKAKTRTNKKQQDINKTIQNGICVASSDCEHLRTIAEHEQTICDLERELRSCKKALEEKEREIKLIMQSNKKRNGTDGKMNLLSFDKGHNNKCVKRELFCSNVKFEEIESKQCDEDTLSKSHVMNCATSKETDEINRLQVCNKQNLQNRRWKACRPGTKGWKLRLFYENDYVSKKCIVQKFVGKYTIVLKPRRVLRCSMRKLFQLFLFETNNKISYSAFVRGRPYWVIPRRVNRNRRGSCDCMIHNNMNALFSTLIKVKVIKKVSLTHILKFLVCSLDKEDCMLEKCSNCKMNQVQFNYKEDFKVKYYAWKRIFYEKVRVRKNIEENKIVKIKEIENISSVVAKFYKLMSAYKKHVFCIKMIQKEMRECELG